MSLVVDASLALSWCFEDEHTPASDAILDQVAGAGCVVPPLWRLEVANGLQMAIRRKRIGAAFRDRALQQIAALPIRVDPDCDSQVWTATLQLADRYGLTLYDATYLELALRRQLPLATLDKKLGAAAQTLGVSMTGKTQ